ncbi:EamA family transporter [Actinophytocola xanthii]|uniref:EamA family transporter n=1 Tax=Actinophytocola xanthii TaxID=1912961 RepID=UPI00130179EB|nr:EamA family transporter [Actinophytocola xanthii]
MSGRLRVLLALLAVYLLWGSTYTAIEIMLETVPPLLGTGVRFLLAALVLSAFLLPRGGRDRLRLPFVQLRNAALAGLLTLAAARGLVSFGQQFTASGPAALLVATVPLWIVLYRVPGPERPRPREFTGVVAGLAGLALLCLPGSTGVSALSAAALLTAAACEAAGAFGTAALAMPEDPLTVAGVQLATSGAALVVLSAATAEFEEMAFGQVSAASALAVLYLAVPGGVVPFACLVWLLRTTSVSTASTYAFVNPVVAVLVGWLLLGEPPQPAMLAGGALVLCIRTWDT